jgi:hypothetical protein
METQVINDLEKVAKRLEKDGWCRGTYWDGDRSCLEGAIWKATGAFSGPATDAIRRTLADDYQVSSLVSWNDKQRDRRKVVRMIRRTIRRLQGSTR